MKKFPLGIQLYSVREECKKDFKGTLATLAKLGFNGVEFAWQYGGMTPDQLAAFLRELDLKCCGLHAPLDPLLDAGSEWYAYAKAAGSPFITTSCAGEVAKDWTGTIEKIKQAGAVAQSVGLTFTYHNHSPEFQKIGGQYALDVLYERTDPKAVQSELDTFWIKKGGADPAAYILKYKGRAPQVHLKDMNPTDGSFTEIGAGLIDLPAVYKAAEAAGARWMIYEQDTSRRTPLESARISIENLRKASLA